MEPTQEQIKEFWEWCGFQLYAGDIKHSKQAGWYLDGMYESRYDPLIDLNNLFKYAVPKISPKTLMIESYIDDGEVKFSAAILSEKQSGGLWCGNDKDPALALFWALYEVMNKEVKDES